MSASPYARGGRGAFLLGLVGFMLGACNASSGPSVEDYDDVAVAVANLIANDDGAGGETGSFADAASMGTGDGAVTVDAEGRFETAHAGLRYSYTIACTDAEGASEDVCGADTRSAHVTVAWSGDLDLPRYDASVERTGDWTLGIDPGAGEAVFNGEGTFDVSSEFQSFSGSHTASFDLSYAASYGGVVIALDTLRPKSGGIAYDVRVERKRAGPRRTAELSFDVAVDVKFLGGGFATITLDSRYTYSLELATGDLVILDG
ncbi:MAG: hypothetical protein R3A78_08815 [Polyangiales bacterium]